MPTATHWSYVVWRSVNSRLLDNHPRHWLWWIENNAIVINLKRLQWRRGDGMCPRTGCTRWEGVSHVFWQCDFASLVWEWIKVLTAHFTCVNTRAVSQDYVLYGLSSLSCSRNCWKHTFVAASINLALWGHRRDVLFRGLVRRSDTNLVLVKLDIRLRVEADFPSLSGKAFGRRWGPLVTTRAGRVMVHL